jgi:hypothetical protein
MNEFQKIVGSLLLLLIISNLIDQYNPTNPLITGLTKSLAFKKLNKQHEIQKVEEVLSDVKTKLKQEMSNEVDSFVEDELKKAGENGQLSSQIINIISDKLKTKYFDPSDDLKGTLVSTNSPILYTDIPSHFNLDDSSIQYKSLSLSETPVSEPKPRKSYNIDGQQFFNPCDPSEKFGFVDANGSFDNYAPF